MKIIKVAAGILVENNHYLCMKRGACVYPYLAHKYEFPGGKLEAGETGAMCLQRELKEEMNLDIRVEEKAHFMTVDHRYEDFCVHLITYLLPLQSRRFDLLEHEDYQWLEADALKELDWAAADQPIIEALIKGKDI